MGLTKQLHKRHIDYTKDELRKIKHHHCVGCEHFKTLASRAVSSYETSKAKKDADHTMKYNFKYCDYLNDTGKRRICEPELCPYGVKEKGVKLNKSKHEEFVDFTDYCTRCKYRDFEDTDEPCSECLKHPKSSSGKPTNWERAIK